MQAKRYALGLGAGIGFLLLILDGRTALAGAAAGIELCIKSVIPALFPFFVLSDVLVCALWGGKSSLLRPLGRLFGMPEGAESLLLSAFLGGYPVGTKEVSKACASGQLKKEDALRLLSFCNQPGPAFLFGMVGPCLPERWMAWVLWGIILVSALFVSLLTRPGTARAELPPREIPTPAAAMGSALRVMGSVCGWVIIFRVAAAFLDRWALCFLPSVWKTAALGALELSNGCCMLCQIPDARVRFLLAAGMLSFGGLCVTMQTISLLDKLPVKTYLWGKALQTGLALALSCAAVYGHVWYCTVPAILAVILLCRKKAVAFSRKPLYNG